jgi:hypothetical protein
VRPILSFRSILRALPRRSALPEPPIIFDFTNGRVYEGEPEDGRDLIRSLMRALMRRHRPVVMTMSGTPPPKTVAKK